MATLSAALLAAGCLETSPVRESPAFPSGPSPGVRSVTVDEMRQLPPPGNVGEVSCRRVQQDPERVAFVGIELVACRVRGGGEVAPFLLRFYGENTPAQRAGLNIGDRILKVRGCPVSSPATARWQIDQTLAGSELTLFAERGGRAFPVLVTTEVRQRVPPGQKRKASSVAPECWRLGLDEP